MLYTDNNANTQNPLYSRQEASALPFIVAGTILLLICVVNFAVLHCKGEETAKKDAASKAGDLLELTIKNVKYRFRYCPAGTFKMGSPESEKYRDNAETLHPVTLPQGFWLGETEITQEQWESIMGNNPSKFKGAKLPVERVSWNDCQDFVKKLNVLLAQAPAVRDTPLVLGLKAALPTEAQWEYACRAGSTTAYCFGDDEKGLGAYCWHRGNSGRTTHQVGTKKANAWNLYDMHGNVYECCNDWDGSYPSPTASSSELIDPVVASSGGYRALRGGSWRINAKVCRSANRLILPPGGTGDDLGVRVSIVSGGQ